GLTVLALKRPQSLPFDLSNAPATTSAITLMLGGVDEIERSDVGWLEATRTPSRAAVANFCLRVKAAPKSKIPTMRTISHGRETANSTIWAPLFPPRSCVCSSNHNLLTKNRRFS